jgi:rod shape-determining protein MreD
VAVALGIPILAALAILQSSLLSQVRLLEGAPDLILVAVIGWALTGRAEESMILGFIGGIFLDLLSGVPFGVTALALVIVTYVVSASENRFWGTHPLLQMAATLLSSGIFHAVIILSLVLTGRSIDFNILVSRVLLPTVFLNLLLVLPAVQFAEFLRRNLYPPEVEI